MRYVCIVMLCAAPVLADLSTQIDTFGSGTTENWDGGLQAGGTGPVNTPTSGPDGGAFLTISHSGFHVGTKNAAQWAGNYLAASLTALRMDLKHQSGDSLDIRIVLFGSGGMWASAGLQTVDATWKTYEFGLTSADLVYVGGGSGVLDDTLGGVSTLLIRHDRLIPTPQRGHPPHVTAALGIDNIHAIPEPASLAYMLAAGAGLYLLRAGRFRI